MKICNDFFVQSVVVPFAAAIFSLILVFRSKVGEKVNHRKSFFHSFSRKKLQQFKTSLQVAITYISL